MVKKIFSLLMSLIFVGNLLADEKNDGCVIFENLTDNMVLRIDTQTSNSRGVAFEKKGDNKGWQKSTDIDRKRLLHPGDKWKVRIVDNKNISTSVAVYYNKALSGDYMDESSMPNAKDNEKVLNFRGYYKWKDDINVKNNKITRVKFKYDPGKVLALGRQVRDPYDADKGNGYDSGIKEGYWENNGGMGGLKLVNNTGKKMKISCSGGWDNLYDQVFIPDGQSRTYPARGDITTMHIKMFGDNIKTVGDAEKQHVDTGREWSNKNSYGAKVDISSGKLTIVTFEYRNAKDRNGYTEWRCVRQVKRDGDVKEEFNANQGEGAA